jgi:hypothetical protein
MFTIAKTKIAWYILSVYPPLAICIGAACGSLLRGPKQNIIVQLAVIMVISKLAIEYEGVIKDHILLFKNDNKRVSFRNFRVSGKLRGAKAYVYYGMNPNLSYGPKSGFKDWKQSDLLSAELYWDFKPAAGGLGTFLRDGNKDIVLILIKDGDAQGVISRNNLKVLGESNYIYILGK